MKILILTLSAYLALSQLNGHTSLLSSENCKMEVEKTEVYWFKDSHTIDYRIGAKMNISIQNTTSDTLIFEGDNCNYHDGYFTFTLYTHSRRMPLSFTFSDSIKHKLILPKQTLFVEAGIGPSFFYVLREYLPVRARRAKDYRAIFTKTALVYQICVSALQARKYNSSHRDMRTSSFIIRKSKSYIFFYNKENEDKFIKAKKGSRPHS